MHVTTKSIYTRNIIEEIQLLHGMSSRWISTKILENTEDKKTIKDSFKRIDEYTEDFQMCDSPPCEMTLVVICCLQLDIIMTIERNTNEIQNSLDVCVQSGAWRVYTDHECQKLRLVGWPHSKLAAYNADLRGTATVIREPCTEDTRVDILGHTYKWALNPSSDGLHAFWLMGQAGSGKSTIVYTVADHFNDEDRLDPTRKYILGANFCSLQFEETRWRKYIIPTITYQLAQQSRSYASALLRVNKSHSVNVPAKQMKDLLVRPWQQSAGERDGELRPYLIVVDALDEIEDNGGLAFLQELVEAFNKGHLHSLKFLVTSRPDPKLAALCSLFDCDAVCHLYKVPMDKVEADILKYLTGELPELQGHDRLAQLFQKADGLFISPPS